MFSVRINVRLVPEADIDECRIRSYQLVLTPSFPPTPVRSSPKLTSILAKPEVRPFGENRFSPPETLAPHVGEIIGEDEAGATRGELRLIIIAGKIAPETADHEGFEC